MSEEKDITELLLKWNIGNKQAFESLIPLVYDELRRIASLHLRRESQTQTLQTTALVYEAYLKLIDQTRANWQNRAQFLGVSANIMRRILIDNARKRLCGKRGGSAITISIDDGNIDVSDERASELIALDEALEKLAKEYPEKAKDRRTQIFWRIFHRRNCSDYGNWNGYRHPSFVIGALPKPLLYKEINELKPAIMLAEIRHFNLPGI